MWILLLPASFCSKFDFLNVSLNILNSSIIYLLSFIYFTYYYYVQSFLLFHNIDSFQFQRVILKSSVWCVNVLYPSSTGPKQELQVKNWPPRCVFVVVAEQSSAVWESQHASSPTSPRPTTRTETSPSITWRTSTATPNRTAPGRTKLV